MLTETTEEGLDGSPGEWSTYGSIILASSARIVREVVAAPLVARLWFVAIQANC
jgi:hypothetical protein